MNRLFVFILLILMSLGGCGGSSTSNSGAALSSGTVYDSNIPRTVSTLAGTVTVAGSTDGIGVAAQFGQPNGVIVSPDGTTLYVADFGNNTIRKIVIATGAVSSIAGSTGVAGVANGTGTAATFNSPHGITTDGTNLYVTDLNNNMIRKIVINTGVVTTLAGSSTSAAGSTDGIGTAANFSGPSGITVTPDGTTLFVTDYFNNTIRKIIIATGAVTTLALNAVLSNPAGIITDGTSLFVTEFSGNIVRKVDIATGTVTTLAGSSSFFGSADGIGSLASFQGPNGITLLGTNLYVADSLNGLIRKISIPTGAVTTVAGTPGVFGSANGTGASSGLNFPIGITTDGTRLFVGDSGNFTIRVIQ